MQEILFPIILILRVFSIALEAKFSSYDHLSWFERLADGEPP